MIRMTLHAVTVECETLTQALVLLDEWARMGRIELPPEPSRPISRETEPVAPPSSFPRVPRPAKPTPRKAAAQVAKCGVCGIEFIPPNVRVVTCSLHRLKAGQSIATERARFLAREGKTEAPAPPKSSAATKAAAKALLGRPAIRPDEPTEACKVCGDQARKSEMDEKGRCRDCKPVGGAK
jgi:hypothetical protein